MTAGQPPYLGRKLIKILETFKKFLEVGFLLRERAEHSKLMATALQELDLVTAGEIEELIGLQQSCYFGVISLRKEIIYLRLTL